MRHKNTYHRGLVAEKWALWILRLKGYRILHHRFRTPVGEIDLIAKRGRMLIMVEVKARPSVEEGLWAVTAYQQKRYFKAASFFLKRFPHYQNADIRFDVVVKKPWRWPVWFQHVIFHKARH